MWSRRLSARRGGAQAGLSMARLRLQDRGGEAVAVGHRLSRISDSGVERGRMRLRRPRCRNRRSTRPRISAPVAACAGCWRGNAMCRAVMPRLRAASSVRSSSAEPTPWLCQGCSMLKAASASRENGGCQAAQFGAAAQNGRRQRSRASRRRAMRQRRHGRRMKSSETAPPNRRCRLCGSSRSRCSRIAIVFAQPQFADAAAIGKRFCISTPVKWGAPRIEDALLLPAIWCNAAKIRCEIHVAGLVRKNACLSIS